MNNWTAVAVIVAGYVVGAYFQARYIDAKLEGLRLYIDARFIAVDAKFDAVGAKLAALDKRLERVENQLTHPITRP